MPLVIAEAFARLPIGEFRIQVNNRKIPEGFYLGIGLDDVATTLRIVDKLAKIGPEPGRRALLIESGASRGPGPPGPRAGLDQQQRPVLRGCRARPGRAAPHPRRGPGGPRRGHRGRDGAGARRARRRPEGRPRPRLLHRHGLRDPARRVRVVGVGLLRRPLRLARQRRAHHLPGCRHLDRPDPAGAPSRGPARLTASRSTPAAVLVAVNDEETREASRRVAAALRARGIPCEVAPSAARFGKQIRYADRRGIPFVWFPGAGEGGDQVKDIRSGDAGRRGCRVVAVPRGGPPPGRHHEVALRKG